VKPGTGDEESAGPPSGRSGTAQAQLPPAVQSQQDQCPGHDGHPGDDHQTSMGAYIARLVDAAPPLTSEQRDTLALLLRRPHRK